MNIVVMLMRKRKGVSLKCISYVLMFALGFAVAYGVSAIVKASGRDDMNH
jgi:ABC-type nickel/cobalt efflux system permease component RcnA